jgi:class 3 adenylate cyclase/predicted ATPase
MTFDEILTQIIDLLKRQGRVSYGALKRRFDLNDAYLEDLKGELLYVHEAEVEADERGFTWTGATADLQGTISRSNQAEPQSVVAQAPPAQDISASANPRPPDAERRQLTVMFCDLVASTQLASQLDPEVYRDVVRAYQSACTEVIQRFDGHVAQLLGDGLLIYFGYPHAHEDDAQRAVRTGLGILAAMGDLNTRLQQTRGIQLAIRVGIHTGLVVVGEMGEAGRQEQLALGETPNIAARIQGLAAPNTMAISEATYRLVEGYFTSESLGEHTLRGVSQPLNIYRVLGVSDIHSRLEVAQTRGLTPLVGREQEVGLLFERWEQVKAGHGHVILLTGDPGIGKSRLVQMLKDRVTQEPHVRWECRSVPYYQNTALYPLTDLFQRTLQWQQHETPDEKLGKLEQTLSQYRLPLHESVPLFAPLLSLSLPEHHYPPLNLSPQRQRQKTLETISAILLELAEHQPVLFIVEDLHWADPTTLELLNLVLDQTPTASLLVLLTCRPTFQPSWSHRSYLTEVTVHRLSQHSTERMTEQVVGGKRLPAEVLQQIIEKTDGVPLFVEELTKAILESGQLKAFDGHYAFTGSLRTLTIPATLQDSLMARLDRLMTGKVIAQLGATIGRQFSYALLQAVAQLNDRTLHEELHRLVEAELLYQRGLPPQATYVFKHVLIQDAAYQSLLKTTRQQYHQQIAHILEAQFPETTEAQPELLAHHYTEAGLAEQAVHYWQHAGQRATERSAYVEAIAHLTQGLALLKTLPESHERVQREVDMLIALGASLLATKGQAAPEVAQTYTGARHLCQHLAEPHQLFPILRGLWMYSFVHAEYQTAHALGEQLLTLAQQSQDPVLLVAAHRALGATLFHLGAPASAHTHLAQGLACYDPQQHRAHAFLYLFGEDTGVVCHSFSAWTLWCLGYPDQGLTQIDHALTLAQQLAHPLNLVFALSFAAMFHQFRREVRVAQEHAAATISLAQERGFPSWMALGAILRGWTLAQRGQAQEGIAQITQGLRAFRATGAEIARPYCLALLAEAHGILGKPEAGLAALTEALTLVDTTGERWSEPELYRLKGELLLQQSLDHPVEAEACFHQAITIAQNQKAKSWELRAATSLARLWQQQGKRDEARQLLGDVYNWFTEGFDTADLQDAKVLLDALSENQR